MPDLVFGPDNWAIGWPKSQIQNGRSICGAASEVGVAADVLAPSCFTLRMFEHVLCQIIRNRLDMSVIPNIAGEQMQECTDCRIFMLGVGTAHDDGSYSVLCNRTAHFRDRRLVLIPAGRRAICKEVVI